MALLDGLARDRGPQLKIGGLVGYAYPSEEADRADVAVESARNIWLFEYVIRTGALFVGLVGRLLPHPGCVGRSPARR